MTKKLSAEEKGKRQAAHKVAEEPREIKEKVKKEAVEKVVTETAPGGVPIQELQPGQKFELDSDTFVVKTMGSEEAVVAKLEYAPDGGPMTERWQRPVLRDTLVVPRE